MDSFDDGHHEQLDLNAPIISVKHPSGGGFGVPDANFKAVSSSGRSVPFSWEVSPGVPKDTPPSGEVLSRPPPPPAHWRPPPPVAADGGYGDGEREEDDDVFSDAAAETLTLSEYSIIGVACTSSSSGIRGAVDGFDHDDSDDEDDGSNINNNRHSSGPHSPDFIIRRFLPAAEALAAASTCKLFPSRRRQIHHHHHHHNHLWRQNRTAETPTPARHRRRPANTAADHLELAETRSCGLVFFFPWGLKQALCGFRTPIRSHSPARIKIKESSSSCRSITDVDGVGGEDEILESTRVMALTQSPGWGLNFLDGRGSWERRGEKKLGMVRSGSGGDGGKGESRSRGGGGKGGSGTGKVQQVWSLPPLKSPSEPWLSHALYSTRKRA